MHARPSRLQNKEQRSTNHNTHRGSVRMQPGRSATHPSSPTLHHNLHWLPNGCSDPIWLRMAQARLTSRTWSYRTLPLVYHSLLLPNGLLLSHCGVASYCSTKSQLFAVLAPQWWNELPVDIRTAGIAD